MTEVLFSPLQLRTLRVRNRAWMSPMCQHSAEDGLPNNWHLVHLGSRAVGGAGLVMTESTSVRADGRISPHDVGMWSDEHVNAWQPITRFVREQGAVAACQLSHAGRKASTWRPWEGRGALPLEAGGWSVVGPAASPYPGLHEPTPLDRADLDALTQSFTAAAVRALAAGFQVVELHAAHGYLLHQFLSPLSNAREDSYGGDLEGRMRYPLEVVGAVRDAWPEELPLFVRISATDWVEGGWTVDDSVIFAGRLRALGVDLVDVSSGGNVPDAVITVGPGYQVPFAARVRREADVPTAAVGLITTHEQAEEVLRRGDADAIMIGRAHLEDPYWVKHASAISSPGAVPILQYDRPDLRGSTTSATMASPGT